MREITQVLPVLAVLGILLFGCTVIGEFWRRKTFPIWWPMVFGFLLRWLFWEPTWGLPGLEEIFGAFEEGFSPVGRLFFFIGSLGVYFYLFSEGLQEPEVAHDARDPLRFTTPHIFTIAVFGLLVPLGAGLWFSSFMGHPIDSPTALLVGVSLVATSVTASVKIIGSAIDKKKHDAPSGEKSPGQARLLRLKGEVLSAAVMDDILGLLLLLLVMTFATGEQMGPRELVKDFLLRTGLVFSVVIVMVFVVLIVFRLRPVYFASDFALRHPTVNRLEVLSLGSTKLIFAILLGIVAISEQFRVSGLVAAYSFGFLMLRTMKKEHRERYLPLLKFETEQLAAVLIPIYFAVSGMMVSVEVVLENVRIILVLIAIGVVSKWGGCFLGALVYEPFRGRGGGRRQRLVKASVIGAAMVPRGEVALVVVNIGYALGSLDLQLLNALLVTIVATTFLGPVFLTILLKRWNP